MLTYKQIFWRYTAFCLIALMANLAVQAVAHECLHVPNWLSIGSGTATALVLKYWLDRNFIFYATKANFLKDLQRFIIYTAFGLFTTLLFWFIEWMFIISFSHPLARYVGAALGAGIGYYLKYLMDRRWVFPK